MSTFDTNTFDSGHEITIPITANSSEFQNYTIPLNEFMNWDSQNRLRQLRAVLDSPNPNDTAIVEYIQLVPGKSWGFGLNDSLDGWGSAANSNIKVSDGKLIMDFSSEVSYFRSPKSLLIDAGQTPYLDLSLINNSQLKSGTLHFETIDSDLSTNSINFDIDPNSTEVQNIRLDLHISPNWQGIVKQIELNFDSEGISEGTLLIDSIAFQPKQRSIWGFDWDENEMGWLTSGHIGGARAQNGTYQGNITGGDPYMYSASNILLDTSEYTKLNFRLKNMSSSTDGEIFFQTTDSRGFAGEKRLTFKTNSNATDFEEITIDMSKHDLWTGEVVAIRIDPAVGVTTGSFEIDDIALLKN